MWLLQVRALEAADAARKKEAQRAAERAAQRQQVEAQKAERAKRAQDAKASPYEDLSPFKHQDCTSRQPWVFHKRVGWAHEIFRKSSRNGP